MTTKALHEIFTAKAGISSMDRHSISDMATHFDALRQYEPTEIKKSSQFTALNQFPYLQKKDHYNYHINQVNLPKLYWANKE